MESRHQASKLEQEAKGQLGRQKLLDQAKAEETKIDLLKQQAQSAKVRAEGEALARAIAETMEKKIKAEAGVNQAELQSKALQIEQEASLNGKDKNKRQSQIINDNQLNWKSKKQKNYPILRQRNSSNKSKLLEKKLQQLWLKQDKELKLNYQEGQDQKDSWQQMAKIQQIYSIQPMDLLGKIQNDLSLKIINIIICYSAKSGLSFANMNNSNNSKFFKIKLQSNEIILFLILLHQITQNLYWIHSLKDATIVPKILLNANQVSSKFSQPKLENTT